MKSTIWLLGLLTLVAMVTGAFIWSGAYNIAADDPHWPSTQRLMETVRMRSIAARASDVVAPELDDESLIRTGAGNYSAMCADCHLQPGVERTELSDGLLPPPPNLSRKRTGDPAAVFWVVKHGIKMTGMPAWGKSMEDEYIWGMVAFLQQLPGMSVDQYRELVEASEGHSHGPAESAADDQHSDATDRPAEHAETHVHADGAQHEHKN